MVSARGGGYICQYNPVNPYSAEIDFSHHNLMSKVDPTTVRVKLFIMAVDD